MLAGPPGCGKTSAAISIAKSILGDEHFQKGCLELNASDEWGLEVVRKKIKEFAQMNIQLP